MKKTTKTRTTIATTMAAVMVVLLTACDSTGGNVGSSSTTEPVVEATEPVVVEEPTEKVVEPTEEVTPEATEEPTPEVTEDTWPKYPDEENPNIIDGIDFTLYNKGEEDINGPLSQMSYDSLKWVVINRGNKDDIAVRAILSDGDSYQVPKNEKRIDTLCVELYVPKHITSYTQVEGDFRVSFSGDNIRLFLVQEDATGDPEQSTISVTYEDGTTEEITVFLSFEK